MMTKDDVVEDAPQWSDRHEPWHTKTEDARDDGAVDFARVIHSGSFRRLQGKTQILNLGESDFYRTRLTHSLEVAQIAGSVARQLEKDSAGHPGASHLPATNLIQAIGLTHDLGHPPFGHGGEVALNYCMRANGGFEGNGQTLRILTKLEKYSKRRGANLARRTLLGALKYPVAFSRIANAELKPRLLDRDFMSPVLDRKISKPPKCYMDCEQDAVDWILRPLSADDRDRFTSFDPQRGKHGKALHKSLDCSIMDVADDIAYGVHDLEDALALKLVEEEDFRRQVPKTRCTSYLAPAATRREKSPEAIYKEMVRMLFGDGRDRKHAISRLVHHFVTQCALATEDAFEEPLLRYRAGLNPEARVFLDALQDLVKQRVILSPAVQQLEFKGQRMVVSVFEVFQSEPHMFLPRDTQKTLLKSGDPTRVICDHVAGMSDSFLLKTYDRLFSPRMGSLFDKL